MNVIFRNFLLVFRRFRSACLLNMLGLSAAFATFIIIIIQVQYEITFDTSYRETGSIYRLESTLLPTEASSLSGYTYTTFLARPLIEQLLPAVSQIESYTLLYNASLERYIQYETNGHERAGMLVRFQRVSTGFTEVFEPELVEGDLLCLQHPGKVLIAESLARKMFGEQAALDRMLFLPEENSFFSIGGVYRDFPSNSSMVNDIKAGLGDGYKNDWSDWTFRTFIRLNREAAMEDVITQLTKAFRENEISQYLGPDHSFRLTSVESIYYSQGTHLDIDPKGNRAITYTLISIALLVVIVAAINYLNFSTALTPDRIKSIHIQKVLGSSTTVLRIALIAETIIICVISFLLALLLVWILSRSGFSSILFITPDLVEHKNVVFLLFIIVIGIGSMAGLYPAFYMTSFTPASILKGSSGTGQSGQSFRLLLTIFQFTVSTGLIITALFMQLQHRYLYNTDSIIDREQIVTCTLTKDMLVKHSETLVYNLLSSPLVTDISFSEWPIGFQDYYLYKYANSPENEPVRYFYLPVSYSFPEMMNLTLIEGRSFRKEDIYSREERIIFNRMAAQQFNISPGDRLSNGCLVIGIVEDFRFMNLRKEIEPAALTVKEAAGGSLPVVYIKTQPTDEALLHIKSAIAGCDPLYPMEIKGYKELFEETYRKEQQLSTQISLFCLLTIIISLCGILSLITFETQYRQKEIAIRKIMGAGTPDILVMLNGKFFRIVFAGFLIAAPIGWYGVNSWLTQFAYKTPLYGWVFLVSLAITLLLTAVTITLRSWDIAVTNPVISLKNE